MVYDGRLDRRRARPGWLWQRLVCGERAGHDCADHHQGRGRDAKGTESTPPRGSHTPPRAGQQAFNIGVCGAVGCIVERVTQVVRCSPHRNIPSRAQPVRSEASSSRSSWQTRRAARALKVWDFTVPTVMPIASAVATSV